MMFSTKKSIIILFKVTSIVFVCFMLYTFIKVLYSNEKINNSIDIFETNLYSHMTPYDAFKGCIHLFNKNFEAKETPEEPQETSCFTQYLTYYFFALVLGAYVNVKRLYKLGPI